MPKQRHTIKHCRARLRPKLAKIKRGIRREFESLLAAKDQELAAMVQRLEDKDKGRSLRSHLLGWWANRKAA